MLDNRINTGMFARSMAGHDKGKLYVILSCDDNTVTVSDGRLKKVESPKKKNIKHIKVIKKKHDESLKEKIENGDKAVNEAIKRAIKLYEREEENV